MTALGRLSGMDLKEEQARLRDLIAPVPLVLGILVFWTAVALIFAGQHALMLAHLGRPIPLHRLAVEELASWMPCALLSPAVLAGTLRVRARESSLLRILAPHTIGAALFVTIGGSLMGILEFLLPWADRSEGVVSAAQWGILRYFGPDLLLYCMIVAAAEAAAHAWESRQRGIAAATYARQLSEARLHVLTTQLQPHFLFNALHAISTLIWEDQGRAERLLARLSDMLRLTLRGGNKVETTLAEELALLERYTDIQETRYGDRVRVSYEVEPRIREALVPRLILQPLVENAIRHGVTPRIAPGRVEVRAWLGDGRLHMTVRDDGVGLRAGVPVREGVGLGITRARLRELYGPDQRCELTSGADGGAVCTLSIPLRMGEAAPT